MQREATGLRVSLNKTVFKQERTRFPREHVSRHFLKTGLSSWGGGVGGTTHYSRLLNQTLTWKLSLVNQFLTGTKTKFLTKLFTYLNLDIHYVLHLEGQMDLFCHFGFHGLSPSFFCLFF